MQGTTERGDTRRLVVYGKSYPQNEAAQRSLGQNNDNFLTLSNPDPACIVQRESMYRARVALATPYVFNAPANASGLMLHILAGGVGLGQSASIKVTTANE